MDYANLLLESFKKVNTIMDNTWGADLVNTQ